MGCLELCSESPPTSRLLETDRQLARAASVDISWANARELLLRLVNWPGDNGNLPSHNISRLQPQREPMAQPHIKLWELAASDDDRVFSPYVWAVKLVLDAKVISLALLTVLTVKHLNGSTLPARLRRSLPRGLRAAGPGVREGALALLSEALDPALPDGTIPDLSVS